MGRRRTGAALPGSAPGLIGPVSLVNWPLAFSAPSRGRARPLRHVHLEIDLAPAGPPSASVPILHEIEAALHERPVRESGSLFDLISGALRGLSSAGYHELLTGRIDRRRRADPRTEGPQHVRVFLEALQVGPAEGRTGRSFGATLRGDGDRRAELQLRWRHRERRHALSLDLFGTLDRAEVHGVVAGLRRHLPVTASTVTRVGHGPAGRG